MRIAILGSGNVGSALATSLKRADVTVRFGVRDKNAWGTTHATGAPVMNVEDAVRNADMVWLAVPASAAIAAARSAGRLSGTIVVDVTNPLRWDGGPVWAPPPEGSMTAALAAALPGTPVVKGFNHFGAEIQANPAMATGPADAYFAGDDANAKRRVMEVASRMGFRALDAGPMRNAATLENMAVLWIQLATAAGLGREQALTMVGRKAA